MSHSQPAISDKEKQVFIVEPEAAQQRNAIRTIVKYAILISIMYVVLYFFMGFIQLAVFNLCLAVGYFIVFFE